MKIFLPALYSGIIFSDSAQGTLDGLEELLFQMIKSYPTQRRVRMARHPLLDLAAQRKANDMAQRDYFGHTAPDGTTPNQLIRATGYRLPDYYPEQGNNCESLSSAGGTAEDILLSWVRSPRHSAHVFALDPFFAEQTQVGVGITRRADGRQYDVFLSAPPYEAR